MKIKSFSRLNFYDLVNRDNIIYFEYNNIPDIEICDKDVFYTIKEGDRPDLIAYNFYKNVDLWWAILKANNIYIWGDVKAGDVIRIPDYNKLVWMITKTKR